MVRALKRIFLGIVLTLAFVLSWFATIPFAVEGELSPVLLGPIGVTVGTVFLFGWIGVFAAVVGSLAVGLAQSGLSIDPTILAEGALYAVGGVLSLQIYRRAEIDIMFPTIRDIGLLLLTAVVAPLPVALGLPGLEQLRGSILAGNYSGVFLEHWMGGFVAVLIFAPAITVWRHPPKLSTLIRIEILALVTSLLLFAGYIFGSGFDRYTPPLSLALLIFTFLIWASCRFGVHGAILVSILTTFTLILGIVGGLGIFEQVVVVDRNFTAQLALLIVGLVAVSLGGAATEHVGNESLLREVNRRLKLSVKEARELAESAERANLAKSKFLSMMSHELRTPLNGVIGFTNLLLDSRMSGTQEEHVQLIRSSGESLLTLIDEILDFNRIVSGQLDLKLKKFSPGRTIKEVISFFHIKAANKGIELRSVVESDVPEFIVGDSVRLRQILTNVIGNAIKFTDQGSVTLSVTVEELAERSITIKFRCADTGIGIKPEEAGKLFEPFVQANDTISPAYGGTGLGLAICRNLCEAMAGNIWLESRHGYGTSVYFKLRFLRSEEKGALGNYPDEDSDRPELANYHNLAKGNPLDILVAEDNKINQKVIRQILSRMGYDCEIASDGEEVISFLKERRFDVILMDVQMPKVDGLEATRRIRNGEHGINDPQIPIVAVTAFALRDDRESCLEAGMNYHLSKPVKLANLASMIRDLSASREILSDAKKK
ncbi:MAG: response regulator [Puniceicoccaceae bacterium]